MADKIVNRLSPAQAQEKWGNKMQTTLPGGDTSYASFNDDKGVWHPVFDEEMKLIGYVLMKQ